MAVSDQLRLESATSPFGRLALAAARTMRTSSSPSPFLFSAVGFRSTRTAGSAPPPTMTWPTPGTWASFCCRIEAAMSYIRARSTTSEVRARSMMGASAGLTFR